MINVGGDYIIFYSIIGIYAKTFLCVLVFFLGVKHIETESKKRGNTTRNRVGRNVSEVRY